MPIHKRNVHKADGDTAREMIIDEQEAVLEYHKAMEGADEKAKAVYQHIADDEETHIGLLNELLEGQAPESEALKDKGEEQAEEILDKMKANDMTSEEAWADFKSQYIEKNAETTIDAKLDTVMSAVQEMKVDIDRITDTVPQMQGAIEEQKTIENEKEGEDQVEQFGDDVSEGMAGEDAPLEDGASDFDSLFDLDSDEELGDEEVSEEVSDKDTEKTEDGEETDDVSSDEEESVTEEEDKDYVPISDIMDEDDEDTEESEEEETVDTEEEADDTDGETDDSEDEEESEEDTEEVLEKMVKALDLMDMRISALERENKALRKMLTVKNEVPMRKSQSRPQSVIRKTVAGSVNRPPVGISYNPNGNLYQNTDAVNKGASIPTVGKNTPAEILAYCDKVANNGM